MAQEGIYKNPIMLNQVAHKSVKVSRIKNFKFAKDMNSVLLAGQEFLGVSQNTIQLFLCGIKIQMRSCR